MDLELFLGFLLWVMMWVYFPHWIFVLMFVISAIYVVRKDE